HGGEIEGFPSAVTGSEHGVIGISRINLDVEEPMNRRVGDIGRERGIVDAPTRENRPPGLAAISAAENVVVASAAVPTIKGAGDHDLRIVGVNGDSNVAKSFL